MVTVVYTFIKKARNTMGASNNAITLPLRHWRSTKVVVCGSVRFLSRRDRDFQKLIFIKLRPTYKEVGTRVSYFLIYYRKIIVPLKSHCRIWGLPLVRFNKNVPMRWAPVVRWELWYTIVRFQTARKNSANKNASHFDHYDIQDIKLFLNSQSYSYGNLNLDINRNRYALLYAMYANF